MVSHGGVVGERGSRARSRSRTHRKDGGPGKAEITAVVFASIFDVGYDVQIFSDGSAVPGLNMFTTMRWLPTVGSTSVVEGMNR